MAIPVINIFAGAGGLAEGFCPVSQNEQPFQLVLAIEKNPDASRTLLLRNFCRQFHAKSLPDAYYQMLSGNLTLNELMELFTEEANVARNITLHVELGNKESFPDEELHVKIRSCLAENLEWVLIGGPPCQAYSKVGRARNKGNFGYTPEHDPRFFLYQEYLKVLGLHRPAVFVLENVLGLLSARVGGEKIFPRMLDDLARPSCALHRMGLNAPATSYRLYSFFGEEITRNCDARLTVVKTEELGFPQARHRVVIIGVREDIARRPRGNKGGIEHGVAGQVLKGLPPLRSGLSRGADNYLLWHKIIEEGLSSQWFKEVNSMYGNNLCKDIYEAVKYSETLELKTGSNWVPFEGCPTEWMSEWYEDNRLKGTINHVSKSHMPGDLHRYIFASSFASRFGRSPLLAEYPKSLLPAHRNVLSGKFPDRFRVQLTDKPAKTITSHLSQDGHYFIHPEPWQCRSLTVREAARLQTFPDNYYFTGGKVAQYIQVGNAVPPLLGRLIADQVFAVLVS